MFNRPANNLISGHCQARPVNRFSLLPADQRIRTRFDTQTRLSDGRYTIEGKIADGGYSELYLADDTQKNRRVALKVFGDRQLSGHDNWNICRMEARLHDRFNSGRCVRVYDYHVCRHGGGEVFVLSMEYLDGETFRDWLETNKDNMDIRLGEGPGWFEKICLCVQDIHNSGLLHLDVKPENFIFTGNDIKAIDFGTSAFVSVMDEEPEGCCEQIPATPLYMAPELFTISYTGDLKPAADIYSLGIILYELVSPDGRPPFDGSFERLRCLHTSPGIGPEHLNRIDERFRPLLRKCLHRDPLQRFQSPSELIRELNEIKLDTSNDQEQVDNSTLIRNIMQLGSQAQNDQRKPGYASGDLSSRKLTAQALNALKMFQIERAAELLREALKTSPGERVTARNIGLPEEFPASVETQRVYIENFIIARDFSAAVNQAKQLVNYIAEIPRLRVMEI